MEQNESLEKKINKSDFLGKRKLSENDKYVSLFCVPKEVL